MDEECGSVERCGAQILSLLDSSVRDRLVADVPLGLFLSGGIDSSAIAASAIRSRPNIDAITIGFDEADDERPLARLTATRLGIALHEENGESAPFSEAVVDELLQHFGQPFHDTSDANYGGPHSTFDSDRDMACANPREHLGCRMNGFVARAEAAQSCTGTNPSCIPCNGKTRSACLDAMGYHTGADIPNYWSYAQQFGLADNFFASAATMSEPNHIAMIAGQTGGGYFELTSTADLARTFARVADELHHQYALGFEPAKLDGKLHTLEVRVNASGLTARARRSYRATRER